MAQGVFFRGFTTAVVGMELLRNAHEGFGAGERFRSYSEDELEEFLDAFARRTSTPHLWGTP